MATKRRGPGRPPKPGGGHVQFRLDGSLYPRLESAAESAGETVAEFARQLVLEALARGYEPAEAEAITHGHLAVGAAIIKAGKEKKENEDV